MGRSKVAYAVYQQKREWTLANGKKKKKIIYRIRYWSGDEKKTMPTGKKTKAEAITFAEDLFRAGKFTMSPDFGDFAADYWDQAENTRGIQPGTLQGYKLNLQYLIRELGKRSLSEMKKPFLEKFFHQVMDGEGKSRSTVKNYIKALSPIFDKAVADEILKVNPLRGLEIGGENQKRVAFTIDEMSALFFGEAAWTDNSLEHLAALLSASTGLRLGEIQALQLKHLVISSNDVLLLKVEQAYKPTVGDVGTTKTIAGKRFVPVIEPVASWLKDIKEKKTESFIFSHDGSLQSVISQRNFANHLRVSYRKALGKERPADKTFHSLRHFFNTRMLILTGHNEALVQGLMGHGTKNNITLHYTTATEDKFIDIYETMQNIFGGIQKEKGVRAFYKDDEHPKMVVQ